VRNRDKKYYPFNYPSLDDITTTGKNNFIDGKPAGLWDEEDIIHTRNYGACRSALWEDLIASGGADEHVDYLGYICAPYEMTHESEWTTTCGTRANSGPKLFWSPRWIPYVVDCTGSASIGPC
jgi:cell wall assembly regulator SMI1